MGAFDGELAALGYGSVTASTIVPDKERIESISVGDHVEWCTGFHYTGVIIGVFEQLVVIRLDKPERDWGGMEYERVMPKDYSFYRVES